MPPLERVIIILRKGGVFCVGGGMVPGSAASAVVEGMSKMWVDGGVALGCCCSCCCCKWALVGEVRLLPGDFRKTWLGISTCLAASLSWRCVILVRVEGDGVVVMLACGTRNVRMGAGE